LRLIDTGLTKSNMAKRDELAAEARELTLIVSAIHLKEQSVMSNSFGDFLRIEFCLGFGNWDL